MVFFLSMLPIRQDSSRQCGNQWVLSGNFAFQVVFILWAHLVPQARNPWDSWCLAALFLAAGVEWFKYPHKLVAMMLPQVLKIRLLHMLSRQSTTDTHHDVSSVRRHLFDTNNAWGVLICLYIFGLRMMFWYRHFRWTLWPCSLLRSCNSPALKGISPIPTFSTFQIIWCKSSLLCKTAGKHACGLFVR